MKSIHGVLKQQRTDQPLHGQYWLHGGCVICCMEYNEIVVQQRQQIQVMKFEHKAIKDVRK